MGYGCKLCGGNGLGFLRIEIVSGDTLAIVFVCPACLPRIQDDKGEIRPTANLLRRAEVI